MNLLFSIDDRFWRQMLTVLNSIRLNSQSCQIDVYVIQSQKLAHTKEIKQICELWGMYYHPIVIKDEEFDQAPVTDRYPKTIYYRLLAHQYLPKQLHRILYLDADVLCINDIGPLYDTDLDGCLYASAIHTGLTGTTEVINKIRLQNFDADGYYNSGVLLMNLDLIRQRVHAEDIYEYIREHVLLLPDQDVLNALYGKDIKTVPDQLYNFDARKGQTYETISFGEWTLDWVIKHTVILHYCGRHKPWLVDKNTGRYTALYKNYFQMTQRVLKQVAISQTNPTVTVLQPD
ncbi:glycosyltransferase family 8 protein [Limosilactobacillus mucosae]|uniref:glycosyltransferase family 8 protein n=1 Tax=Limosilactobacillus mucosae TaxID=97478 RepID=UPI0025A3D412|nr:glycosyltransferase family 8 protein [Limosilactobacillus mucosae]MDM8220057.1 glycosyltransferase family 8 protein [Limosilactobacillus mucosae]MDM8314713.1 glycosyltransferase family 8 protein [Limosilactobacillus mucosae]